MSDYRDFYRGRKVLVTGGLGFIGSQPLPHARRPGGRRCWRSTACCPTTAATCSTSTATRSKVRINIADVRGHGMELPGAAARRCCSTWPGQVSHIDSMTDPFTDLEINCRSQLSILEAVRQRQPEAQDRLRGHAPGLRQAAATCRWTRQHLLTPDRRERHQQDLGRDATTSSTTRCTASAPPRCASPTPTARASSSATTARASSAGSCARPRWARRSSSSATARQKRDFNHVDDVVDAFLRAGAMDAARRPGLQPRRRARRSRCCDARRAADRGRGRAAPTRLVPFPQERKRIDIGDFHADTTQDPERRWAGSRAVSREGLARHDRPTTARTRSTTCERRRRPLRGLRRPTWPRCAASSTRPSRASSTPAGSSSGPEGEAFEQRAGARRVGATDAVAVAQRHRGASSSRSKRSASAPGDEVITSPLTRRASPALADPAARARDRSSPTSTRRTLNVAPDAVAARDHAAHQGAHAGASLRPPGRPRPAPRARPRAQASPFVEDACQAHGARYKGRPVGAICGPGRASVVLPDQEPGRARRRRAPSW